MNDITKIVESLKNASFLIKRVRETIKNEAKEETDGFLGMLLDTLDANLIGNLLAGTGVMRADKDTIRAGEGTIRVGQDVQCCLIL